MPSFRRDRPESGPNRPSGFRRDVPPRPRPRGPEEEEEVEERGFRSPPMFRRDMGPSQFASRPIGPQERRNLEDVLVPQSEREDPYFDYGKVFEMFPRFRRGPAAGPGPGPVPPLREAPPRGEPQRPGRAPGQPPVIDAAMFFDLGRIWNAAAQLRQDQRFRPGSPVAVVRTAPSQEIHRFFRIRPDEVSPFLDELSYSINTEKPRELPGRFLFQQGKDGFVWLAYVE